MQIEKIFRQELDALISEGVYLEEPNPRPTRYVVIEKTNGGEIDRYLYSSMISAFCYADTMEHASDLCETVKRAARTIESNNSICKITLNSDYNYTDTSKKGYRYRALFDVIHY